MIRVAEVSSDSNIGGAGKCILSLLKNYNRKKFELILVIPRNSLLKKEAEKYNVKIFELDNLAEKSLDVKAISGLKRLFKTIKPDIVHTHASMSARIAAKLCKIKTVYTRHSVFPPSPAISKGVGKKINGLVNNMTADRIIAVAEAAKDNLIQTGVSADKIEVILNGVEPLVLMDDAKKAEVRKQYGISPDDRVAVIAARLNEVKGHTYFVKAADILKKHGLKFKFLIAGTGECEIPLKKQISELGLEDTVKMLGFQSDVAPLMNIADVQVNCSFGTEATSLALLEGMSLGKPAVVTDFGGNPGVITDGVNGFLTPTHNPESTADSIEKLFTDTELYKIMSENSKKIYAEKFTAEVNTRKTEAIYQSLVNSI